jgi:hypothetical protein
MPESAVSNVSISNGSNRSTRCSGAVTSWCSGLREKIFACRVTGVRFRGVAGASRNISPLPLSVP